MADAFVPLCASGEDCAIMFARTPEPGRVKSRLCTRLTPEQACRLHCASTNDVMELLDRSLRGVPQWLFLSERPETSLKSSGLRLPHGFGCAIQEGGNLGERMSAAFVRAFDSGARRVVIFGSDSPTLPSQIVQQAFREMAECDLVLGPTEDGGYYLIGCRRFDAGLFQAVEWSTPRAFEQTLANAERLGYQVAVLEPWFDLDEWKDMERILAAARRGEPLPFHLAAFLKELEMEGKL